MGVTATSQSKGNYHMSIDIERILLELEVLPEFSNQIMLQGIEGQTDHTYGLGQLYSLKLGHEESDFKHPLFDIPYTNQTIQELGMTRTRVMKMPGKTCYSYHVDESPRMHIPLITNENCFFVIEDEVVRLPADGNHYLIDTTKKHTFVNASYEDRIHIVGCIA